MEIKITTTEKKLSKSLVSQMKTAGRVQLLTGKPLGYILNCVKDSYKIMLIEYDYDYYILSMEFKKKSKSLYRSLPKGSITSKKFDTEKACNDFWDLYSKALKIAECNHIYI